MGLCENDLRSQIPFGWFLTVWISEPVTSVDTVFFCPNLPGQTLAILWDSSKFIRISQEGYTSPSRNDQFDQVARQEKWLSTLNNSNGISGTKLTSLQPEEWLTSKVPTPSPHSYQQRSTRVFSSRDFPANLSTPIWSVFTVHMCSRKQATQAPHIDPSTMSRPGINCIETQYLVFHL